MKIWIDILTPKQLIFSEPLIEKLSKKHEILCTSRSYNEVSKLSKIRQFKMVFVGKHGESKNSKLERHLERMKQLYPIITKFSPDLTISFCSPEAARISFGLTVKHIAFCDSPHAEAVMKLTLPLVQKLLIPWIIPKKEFLKFGINSKNIIPYRAIDASVTIKRKSVKKKLGFKKSKKNILVRIAEEHASYTSNSSKIIPIIKKIIDEFHEENILIIGRYSDQIEDIRKIAGKNAKVLGMQFDGKFLLENIDVFIGSGGTMTAESALMGIPTISYEAVPNIVEKYLVKNNLVVRETNPSKIIKIVRKSIDSSNEVNKNRANRILNKMENPISKLLDLI
jgi:predicted glycosyltransferase